MIWLLSFVNIGLILILIISVYKKPSLLVFALASTFFVFLVRPFAILSYGSTIITKSYYSDTNYQVGLFAATAFYIIFFLALILFYHKKSTFPKMQKVKLIKLRRGSIFLPLVLCTFFLALFLYVGGVEVLFVNRSASISVVAPSLRYIYPFGIVFLCIGSMQGAILLAQNRFVVGSILLAFYLLASMILAQRGFFILFVVVGIALSLRTERASLKSYFLKIFPFIFVLLAAVSSKQILMTFFGPEQSTSSVQNMPLSEKILSSPDGDTTEVWMLATKFINENDYLLGKSVVNNIFNIFPHNQRREWNVMNGSDILNNEYTGQGYWDLGFGFNVQLPIELYINFGIFGLIPMCLFGIILGSAQRQFDDRIIYYGRDPTWEVLRLYAVYTICNSLAGLQWSIMFYSIYILMRLRLRRNSLNKSMIKPFDLS